MKKLLKLMAATGLIAANEDYIIDLPIIKIDNPKYHKSKNEQKKCKSCLYFINDKYKSTICNKPLNIACSNYKPKRKK